MGDATIEQRALELAREQRDAGRAAGDLVDLAGGRRGPLEEAHRRLVLRLHRRRDDYDATNALRLVSEALERIPRDVAGYPHLAAPVGRRENAPGRRDGQVVDASPAGRRAFGSWLRPGWRAARTV